MFRTELTIVPASQLFSRTARLLTLGSCFADSIGQRLAANKVATLPNPFGTVFQPLAATKLLRAALGEEVDWQQHLVAARGRWQSYDLHGSIGADTPVELLQRVAELAYNTGTFLRNADAVLLTLGTAWVYRLRETGELVNNCHKMPADLFVKELLTPDEIINNLAETHAYLRRINPRLRIILTLSPVRHLKDTLPLNAVSKSVLRVACHVLSELLPDVAYFPAYELLTDDLRDYRFYAADMLHPSEVAEEYIWEKFARTFFDADFGRFRKEWANIRQALAHRPLHEGAPAHRHFLEVTRDKLEQLTQQHPALHTELADVKQRLAALPEPAVLTAAPEVEDDGEERVDIGGEASGATTTDAPRVPVAQPAKALAENLPTATPNPRQNRRDRDNRREQERPAVVAAPLLPANEKLPAPALTEASPLMPTDTPEQVLSKKKKRRSRGGAKRTARKHAAQLAAEAALTADSGATVPGELLPETVPVMAEPMLSETSPASATVAVPVVEVPPATDTRRKESVITKSVPVKRGGRNRNRPQLEPPFGPLAEVNKEEPINEMLPTPAEPAVAPMGELVAEPATPVAVPETAPRGKRKAAIKPLFTTPLAAEALVPEPVASDTAPAVGTAPEAASTQTAAKPRPSRRPPAVTSPSEAVDAGATEAAAKKAPRRKATSTSETLVLPKPRKTKTPAASEAPSVDKPRKAPTRKKAPPASAAE